MTFFLETTAYGLESELLKPEIVPVLKAKIPF